MYLPKEIDYFTTIIEEGNLSKAAEKLCISQPALSKYLLKMESNWDTQFIVRRGNSVSMTEAGQVYYKAAMQTRDILINAEKEIEDIRNSSHRHLIVGTTGSKSQKAMGIYLTPMFEKYPLFQLTVIEKSREELIKKLKNDEIDFAIFATIEDEMDASLTSIVLYNTEVQLAVSHNHRLAKENVDKVDINDLKGERFVLPSNITVFRKNIDRYISSENSKINMVIETKSKESAITYIEAGTGVVIGFYPKYYYPKSKDITYIDLKKPFFHKVALFYKSGKYLTEHAKEFIRLSTEYYNDINNIPK